MSGRIKVWRFVPELVEMHELKKYDFFKLEKDQQISGVKPEYLFMAAEDAKKLPETESGPTAEVEAHKIMFDPNWPSK